MKYLTSFAVDFEVGYTESLNPFEVSKDNNIKFHSLLNEKNTLVVMSCFEESDGVHEIKDACIRIFNIYENCQGVESISVIPFSHLSEFAMDGKSNKHRIDYLTERMHSVLTNKGARVRSIPSNTGNLILSRWLMFEEVESVRHGSGEASLSASLKPLIRAYGIQKVLKVIGQLVKTKE